MFLPGVRGREEKAAAASVRTFRDHDHACPASHSGEAVERRRMRYERRDATILPRVGFDPKQALV